MQIFKLLDDKDVFQKYYSTLLASRLILQTSTSDDAEGSMIAKLKYCCGYEYTAKLNRMFQDMGLSKDLNEEFKVYLREKKDDSVHYDFQVQILSSGSWPFQQCPSDYTLPIEVILNNEL